MSHLKLRALLLCSTFCFTACAADRPTDPAARWTRDSVVGLTMSLIDPAHPARIEWMIFSGSGYGSATYGVMNGPLAAPAFQWRITHGRLQLYDGPEVLEEFTLVSRDSSTIVARRKTGETAKYNISRQ